MSDRRYSLREQRGMVETTLALVLVAVALVGVVFWVRARRHTAEQTAQTKTTQQASSSTSPSTTQDADLDQAAQAASSSATNLNNSYSSNTSSSTLNVQQGPLQ